MPNPPSCIAFIICTGIVDNGDTHTLEQVIEDRVRLGEYPGVMPHICFYLLLRDYRQGQRVAVRVVHTPLGTFDERDITEPLVVRPNFTERLRDMVVGGCIDALRLPVAGVYRFVLEVDGVFVVDRSIQFS